MSQEPKRRHSKTRKRTRRAAIMLKSAATVACPNCSKPTLSHQACQNCGYYRGKTIQASKVQVTKA